MTELINVDRVRCDRCYKEADSDKDGFYDGGKHHPFLVVILEDPLGYDEMQRLKGIYFAIQDIKKVIKATEEGRIVWRRDNHIPLCGRCDSYFKEHREERLDKKQGYCVAVHFCPECWQEIEKVNEWGNYAMPQQCMICRSEIPPLEYLKRIITNLKIELQAICRIEGPNIKMRIQYLKTEFEAYYVKDVVDNELDDDIEAELQALEWAYPYLKKHLTDKKGEGL